MRKTMTYGDVWNQTQRNNFKERKEEEKSLAERTSIEFFKVKDFSVGRNSRLDRLIGKKGITIEHMKEKRDVIG